MNMADKIRSQKQLKQWYESKHYSYLEHRNAKCLKRTARNWIEKYNLRSILDVGCWTGDFVNYIKDLDFRHYLGTDICIEALEEAQKKFGGDDRIRFQNIEWRSKDPLQGKYPDFDVIYFGGVLYYIDNRLDFVIEFLNRTNSDTFIVQDLQSTNVNQLREAFDVLQMKRFVIDVDMPEDIRNRQMIMFRRK